MSNPFYPLVFCPPLPILSSADSSDSSFFNAFSKRTDDGEPLQGVSGINTVVSPSPSGGADFLGGAMGAAVAPLSWVGGVFGPGQPVAAAASQRNSQQGPYGRQLDQQQRMRSAGVPAVEMRPIVGGVPVFSGVAGATQRFNEKAQRGFTTPQID